MFMMPFRLPWQNIVTSTKGKGTIKKKSRFENPAYGRQRISRLMWIEDPILFWVGCVIYLGCMHDLKKKKNCNDVHFFMYIFIFRVLMPSWRTADTDAIVKDSLIMWPEGQWEALETITWKGDRIYIYIHGHCDSIKESA